MFRPILTVCYLVFIVLGGSGCTSSGRSSSLGLTRASSTGYGVRRLTIDRQAAIQKIEQALRDHGFDIATRDLIEGVLVTHPIMGGSPEDARRGVRRIGSPARLRRVATVRIEETSEGAKVFCKVVVQELATEVYRMRAQDEGWSDSPATTAIDQEGATTREQNTVWQTIRRDKRLERDILSTVSQGSEPVPAPRPSP